MTDTGTNTNAERGQAYMAMAAILNTMGLGTLFTYHNDRPGGPLWTWIQEGLNTGEELLFRVEQTPEFARTYGVIPRMRAKAATDPMVQVPTMEEVRTYRQSFSSLLRYYRMPPSFYDQASDADAMLERGVTVPQVQSAMEEGWEMVRQAPAEVRNAFTAYYGPAGDTQMAAFFLDPDRIEAGVSTFTAAARFGGFAQAMGMGNLDRTQAERAAGLAGDMTEAQLRATMNTAATTQRSSRPGGEEAGTTLSSGQAIDVALGMGVNDQAKVDQRNANRRGTSTDGGQGALTAAGLSGLRTAGQP